MVYNSMWTYIRAVPNLVFYLYLLKNLIWLTYYLLQVHKLLILMLNVVRVYYNKMCIYKNEMQKEHITNYYIT